MLTANKVESIANLTIALAPEEAWPVEESNTEAIIDGTVELTTSWTTLSDSFGTCAPRQASELLDFQISPAPCPPPSSLPSSRIV